MDERGLAFLPALGCPGSLDSRQVRTAATPMQSIQRHQRTSTQYGPLNEMFNDLIQNPPPPQQRKEMQQKVESVQK